MRMAERAGRAAVEGGRMETKADYDARRGKGQTLGAGKPWDRQRICRQTAPEIHVKGKPWDRQRIYRQTAPEIHVSPERRDG